MFLHEEQCVFAKEAAFRVVKLSTPPSMDWFYSTSPVLETLTTACVIVVLSKGCVFGY